jgi:transposase InsO family protein
VEIRTTKVGRKGGGRPVCYDEQVRRAIEKLWKRFGYLCGKRLVVVIRTSLPQIASHPELRISAAVQLKLSHISAATVDRLLAPARKRLFLKGVQHTKPAAALAAQIPIRTFGQWRDVGPGHLQIDLVGHDGGIASGEFCFTLCATDVCTGWVERRAILTKAARWVCAALDEMRDCFPYPIEEIHPDNGSEFINRNLISWCRTHEVRITRSRSGRKNDNSYVEQKNFDAIRKLVGYYRYSGDSSVTLLNELYRLHGSLQNYVYPSQKMLSKTRTGSKVSKRYDAPLSPADRTLALPDIGGKVRWTIHARRQDIDPFDLADKCRSIQKQLIEQAIRLSDPSQSQAGASA